MKVSFNSSGNVNVWLFDGEGVKPLKKHQVQVTNQTQILACIFWLNGGWYLQRQSVPQV
jgi:hypothetical protein